MTWIYIPLNRFLLDHTHPIHALEQLQCHSQWWESKGEKLRDTHMHHHFSTLWSECPDPTFLLSLLMHVDHETCLTNPGRKGNTIIICIDEKKIVRADIYFLDWTKRTHEWYLFWGPFWRIVKVVCPCCCQWRLQKNGGKKNLLSAILYSEERESKRYTLTQNKLGGGVRELEKYK